MNEHRRCDGPLDHRLRHGRVNEARQGDVPRQRRVTQQTVDSRPQTLHETQVGIGRQLTPRRVCRQCYIDRAFVFALGAGHERFTGRKVSAKMAPPGLVSCRGQLANQHYAHSTPFQVHDHGLF